MENSQKDTDNGNISTTSEIVLENSKQTEVIENLATNVLDKNVESDKLESCEETTCEPSITETIQNNQDKLEQNQHQNDVELTSSYIEQIQEEPLKTPLEIQECVIIQTKPTTTDESSEKETTNISSNIHTPALSLLANYKSDGSDNEENNTDNESVIEVPTNNPNDYRQKIVEINSDDTDSDTDSSSDCSDTSKKENRLNKLRKTMNKTICDNSDDEDDDGNVNKDSKNKSQPKVKGELLLDDLPPIQDLHITVPENECTELGRVHSIVDQLLLVSVLPNSILVDIDTVLFLDKGKRVLGEVFDVLGQVTDPLYCIRFNSNEQIKEKNINIGDTVYVAPRTEYTQYIILSSLMKTRGSDASWENDVEPPPRYLDYSDDEQERMARARLRNKDRQNPTVQNDGNKRPRNEDNMDTMSVISTDTDCSEQSTSTNRQNRGNRRGRRRGNGPRHGQNHPQYNTDPNYSYPQHSGSWHSNFYQYGPHPYSGYPPSMPMYPMPPYMGMMPPPFWPPNQPPNENYRRPSNWDENQ